MTDRTMTSALYTCVVLMVGMVCGNCWGSMSRADSPTEETLLARLCVNESGMRAYRLGDCSAINSVLEFRAEHIYHSSYIEALHRYSRGVTVSRSEQSSRPWISHLLPSGQVPYQWERRARWEGRHSIWWARTYQHAVDIRRGEIEPSCQPHTWGATSLLPPDISAESINCGDTRNVFWSVPAYADRWGDS